MRYNKRSYSNQKQYVPGDHYKKCDRTGFKIRASDSRREWNGKIVHKDFYEERHPQDFVVGRPDRQNVKDARPEGTDVFVDTNEVTSEDL